MVIYTLKIWQYFPQDFKVKCDCFVDASCCNRAKCGNFHYVKSVRIWSYSGPCFPAFGRNTDQDNSKYGQVLRNFKTA